MAWLSKIRIAKGVPIPPKQPYGPIMTLLKKLKPGNSFLLPNGMKQSSLLTIAKRNGFHITTRKVNGQGCRCWKVS